MARLPARLAVFRARCLFALMLTSVLAATLAHASSLPAAVTLTAPVNELPLSGQLWFLDDEASRLNLEQVLRTLSDGRFVRLPGPLGRGYTNATSWLTFDLTNASGKPLQPLLRLAPQMLDHVDVYLQTGPNAVDPAAYMLHPLGDHVPAIDKPELFPIMALPIALASGESRRVVIRVRTTSSHLLDADLVSNRAYVQDSTRRVLWLSAYEALALGFAMVTFLQALRLRDLTHGLYGLLPLGLCLNSIGTDNQTALLVPAIAYQINDGIVGVSLFFSFGGLALFAMRQFDTARWHRWGHRYLQVVILLSVLTMLASGTLWYVRFAGPLMTLGLGYWAFLTWAAAAMIHRGEVALGRLFILAFTVPLCGAAVGIARYLGLLPQDQFTQYIVPATSLIHMVQMTLSMSERLRLAERHARIATERATLEAEHRQEQQKLLAMISHEIKTPVAVIDAARQTLEALDPDPTTTERKERYGRIRRSVERLALLMDLSGARIRSDALGAQLHRTIIDPKTLTADTIALLDEREHTRYSVNIGVDLPVLEGDEKLLRLAWLNLIDNACKYSTPGSAIRIVIARHALGDVDGIAWSIENTGCGISAGMDVKIFDKFQRGGEYLDKPGLGLGLYLARHVMEVHGGTLVLERPGKQTTRFVCRLPGGLAHRVKAS